MTIDNDPAGSSAAPAAAPLPRPQAHGNRSFLGPLGFAAIGALVIGIAAGSAGTALLGGRTHSTLVLQPAAISSLESGDPAAIKAQVAEVFGNKLVVDDGTGRALVDTGPQGDDRQLAAKGDTITAQGRFDEGVLRAEMLVQANGKVVELGPKPPRGGPPHGPKELAFR